MSQEVHTLRRPFALILGLIAAVALAFGATPAWAHDELIGSDPAAGSRVDAVPNEITMTFSGVLMNEAGATDVVVTDAAGTDLASGDPVIDGTRLRQALSGTANGTVTVIWRVVSSDGHPVSDQFTFTVGDDDASEPAPTAIAPTGVAPSPTANVDDGLAPVAWIGGGVALLAGIASIFIIAATVKRRRSED